MDDVAYSTSPNSTFPALLFTKLAYLFVTNFNNARII